MRRTSLSLMIDVAMSTLRMSSANFEYRKLNLETLSSYNENINLKFADIKNKYWRFCSIIQYIH